MKYICNKYWLTEILQHTHDNNCFIPAKLGYITAFKYYHLNNIWNNHSAIDWAAFFGNTTLIKWLHKHKLCTPTKWGMDNAIINDHFNTVIYMNEHHHVNCSMKAYNLTNNEAMACYLWDFVNITIR